MKQCTKCKEWKDRETGFHKDKGRRDGLSDRCKQCVREHVKQYRQTPQGQATTKKYNQSEQRKAVYSRYNQSQKAKATSQRYYLSEKGTHNTKKFWEQHPEKKRAGEKVRREVYKDRMPKAKDLKCFDCGEPASSYHHHKGYAKEHWLDVIPLCAKCHSRANHSAKKSLNASAT